MPNFWEDPLMPKLSLRAACSDVRAPNLAINARHALGGVDLELRVLEARFYKGRPVLLDWDRARQAACPGVQLLLDGGIQRLELDHVRDGEQPARPKDPERLVDHRLLVLRQGDDPVLGDDLDR